MSASDSTAERPRIRLLVVVAAAIAIVAAIAVFLIARPGDAPTAQATSPGPARTATAAPTSSGSPQQASPDSPAIALPTAAPGGVTWRLIGQVAVPFSSTDGPQRVTDTSASGFARTPVGALVAAVQISTRAGYSAGQPSWEATIRDQFVASADRDALLAILRDAAEAGQQPAAAGELSQVAGFRYLSYTSDTAVIGLVRRTPQGSYAMTTLTVSWQSGDWRLMAPAAGQWPSATSVLSNLVGVIPWGAG